VQRAPSNAAMLPLNTSDISLCPDEIARFSRHLILPEVGMEGQKRLKAAAVLCVGTGGLGSPLLLYLAAAGVGCLGIVDFDVVDYSNLQRQVIHGTSWVGKPKIESAKHRIHEINPHCQVDLYETALTSENALEIMTPYDIICDGTDNFPTRYLVNDACVLLGKPNVYGSIFRFEGQATVFNLDPESPNYRDLFPEPPPPGLVPSCAEGGVVGVLPGIIGIIQATETIKIITGIGTTLSGRLLLFDALTMKFRELKLRPSKERPVIDKLIDYQEFCGVGGSAPGQEEAGSVASISVVDLKALLDSDAKDLILLDVRNPPEAAIAVISGAILVPLDSIEDGSAIERVKELSMGKRLYVHCKLGGRSAKALIALRRHGIEGINIEGGIEAWSKEIDPSVQRY
jgi:adenylyltransferase/sulfurtransferase